ncbi:MAG: hypothetical protein E6H07_01660 [Bacteroidetes bacterium]|nr:MAG: hypothetical protein E6H07_01660 [Bacteroidota bacterium]
MLIELALSGKFIYDIVKRLIHDKVFRTLGFLLFVLMLVGTMFFWLVEGLPFLGALAYAIGTLSMNSPYHLLAEVKLSTIGVIFNIIYIFIGVGVYLIFIIEAGKTIITAYEDFEKKRAEKKAAKKAAKEAKAAASQNQ